MTKPDLITPRTPKGFRDYPPDLMRVRERFIGIAQRVYRSYGFEPIDTPALEYEEILLGKGGEESDKQLFRLTKGDNNLAMRFDLTVPLARFAAQHIGKLGTPFKRYHIGTVWRGENTQAGRYREFMQCDFDTIGTESNVADIETLLVIHDLLTAIGFERFTIRVNNRLILNGLLETLSLTGKSTAILRALDKLLKTDRESVIAEMQQQAGATRDQAEAVLQLSELKGTPAEILDQLEPQLAGSEAGKLGVARLRELFQVAATAGIPAERVQLDLAIARGLDYYTGTIYETFLTDLPTIGSICSGGRYDNLAELYTKQQLPGVGASLGLDRLLAAMEQLGLLEDSTDRTPVLVTQFESSRVGDYQRIGRLLRAAGIPSTVYLTAAKPAKQFKYANDKKFRIALVAGQQEFEKGVWAVKNLTTGEQSEVAEAELIARVQAILRG